MAVSLEQWITDEMAAVRARYAAYYGRRIPCGRGRVQYHRDAIVADQCCGQGISFSTRLIERFRDLPEPLGTLLTTQYDARGRR